MLDCYWGKRFAGHRQVRQQNITQNLIFQLNNCQQGLHLPFFHSTKYAFFFLLVFLSALLLSCWQLFSQKITTVVSSQTIWIYFFYNVWTFCLTRNCKSLKYCNMMPCPTKAPFVLALLWSGAMPLRRLSVSQSVLIVWQSFTLSLFKCPLIVIILPLSVWLLIITIQHWKKQVFEVCVF